MTKKRVHELAKDYGLTGQELASKLRALGFNDIKGPQSTLDEFLLLRVQGTLEANGIVPAAAKADGESAEGVAEAGIPGLVKKKKKRTSLAELVDDASPETGATLGAEVASAPGELQSEQHEPVGEQSPSTVVSASSKPAAAPASTAPAAEAAPAAQPAAAHAKAAPSAEAAAAHLAPGAAPAAPEAPAPSGATRSQVHSPATPTATPDSVAAREVHVVAEPVAERAAAARPAPLDTSSDEPPSVIAAAASAPAIDAPELAGAAQAGAPIERVAPADPAALEVAPGAAADSDIVRPAAKRRAGKVVGFVDLSKVQAKTEPKKPESRRLRSKDDVAPNVQPTLGHDKRKALVRGDQAARGTLTATQLKEKEAGRFLRRKGAGPVTATPTPRGPRSRTTESGSSPFSGGEISISAPITVKKLAEALSIKVSQLLARVMENNMGLLTQNSVIDEDTAGVLALEFNVALRVAKEVEAEDVLLTELVRKRTAVEEQDLVIRPPTVAFLGHVDHGKTTLIDRIRNSSIAAGESGGITQHIGAYQVKTKAGHTLTILDTPGHEAFTAMRARGAQAVDIVVLVVAADDGVMPSTLEALNHARAAKSLIVVAINKIDKPNANQQRVKDQLAKAELIPEEWGGTTAMMPISGLTGDGVEELLERVFLESEVLELKSHSKGPASGVVLEAEVQEGKGRVAHLLVKDGTLNKGDVILAGEGFGRVRSMYDDHGVEIETAGPSMPVQVTGLSEFLPTVGDSFYVVQKLEQAREVAEERRKKVRLTSLAERKQITSENILAAVAAQSKKMINVILRADVQGSLQALESQIATLKNDEIDVKLLQSGLGTVTESDVNLAATSAGIVLAFRVSVNSEAREAAERASVEIRPYDVIYELLDDLHQMMEGELAPEMTQQITGHAEVRTIFVSSKFGNIAGSHVIDGALQRDNKVRVLRGGKLVHESALAGLRREKDEVREVREGFDCGITVRDFDAFELGDVIEGYKIVAVKRKLART